MVVVTQNIVRAAVWLLFTLVGASAVYFLLGADFVGATQLIVYVGGTLVLVVFGVMLTAQGPFVNLKTGAGEWAVAVRRRRSCSSALLVTSVDRRSWTIGEAARPTSCRDVGSTLQRRARRSSASRMRRRRASSPVCRGSGRPADGPRSRSRTCCRLKSCRCICWSC